MEGCPVVNIKGNKVNAKIYRNSNRPASVGRWSPTTRIQNQRICGKQSNWGVNISTLRTVIDTSSARRETDLWVVHIPYFRGKAILTRCYSGYKSRCSLMFKKFQAIVTICRFTRKIIRKNLKRWSLKYSPGSGSICRLDHTIKFRRSNGIMRLNALDSKTYISNINHPELWI